MIVEVTLGASLLLEGPLASAHLSWDASEEGLDRHDAGEGHVS